MNIVARLRNFIEKILKGLGKRSSAGTAPIVKVDLQIRETGFVRPEIVAFIAKIRPAALAVEASYGIPWDFAMVQAAHESRWGLSKLTVEANNLFGITGDSWSAAGKPVYWIETLEFGKDRQPFKVRRPFRKYPTWAASLEDWADLIERRYPSAHLAARAQDFELFANALQSGGYATDPKYAKKLVSVKNSLEGIA
jgi:peptidoglycan hydrolase FlgJ